MDSRTLTGFGRELHSRIRTFFDAPLGPDASPLEVAGAVLDEIERQVQPVGRGRRVFPWIGLQVTVLAPESSSAAIQSAFDGLGARILERLGEVRCEPPRALEVDVTCVDVAPSSWLPAQVYDVRYVADEARPGTRAGAPVGAALPTLQVTVLAGTATAAAFTFTDATVSIGRGAAPTDDLGRLRRNHIAFLDIADEVNATVGRAHARLRRDAVTREYRLFDEGSRNGTSIVRGGDVIPVPGRDPRGVRVCTGDQLHVGRAVLAIEIV